MPNILKNREGVTAIEYGLISGLIAVAIIVVWVTAGDTILELTSTISERLQAVPKQ